VGENPITIPRGVLWAILVRHHHPAGQTLSGRQRDSAHVTLVALRQHFDNDAPSFSGAKHRIDRGKRSSNRTSTTLPRTEETTPEFIRSPTSPLSWLMAA
jgi:hypothetical protein